MPRSIDVTARVDPKEAIRAVTSVLVGLGFSVKAVSEWEIEAKSAAIVTPKQNPIFGVGQLQVRASESGVRAEYDLGGLRWTTVTVVAIGVGLPAYTLIVHHDPGMVLMSVFLLWLPFLRYRTIHAVRVLMDNVVAMAPEQPAG